MHSTCTPHASDPNMQSYMHHTCTTIHALYMQHTCSIHAPDMHPCCSPASFMLHSCITYASLLLHPCLIHASPLLHPCCTPASSDLHGSCYPRLRVSDSSRPFHVLSTRKDGGWNGQSPFTNHRTRAESQRIVAARPLCRLQYPVRAKSSAKDLPQ